MNRTQIYFPKSQMEELKKLARTRGVTTSALIRDLVKAQLDEQSGQRLQKSDRKANAASRQESWTEAAERIGNMGEPGPSDLASNVDKYLYGNM